MTVLCMPDSGPDCLKVAGAADAPPGACEVIHLRLQVCGRVPRGIAGVTLQSHVERLYKVTLSHGRLYNVTLSHRGEPGGVHGEASTGIPRS